MILKTARLRESFATCALNLHPFLAPDLIAIELCFATMSICIYIWTRGESGDLQHTRLFPHCTHREGQSASHSRCLTYLPRCSKIVLEAMLHLSDRELSVCFGLARTVVRLDGFSNIVMCPENLEFMQSGVCRHASISNTSQRPTGGCLPHVESCGHKDTRSGSLSHCEVFLGRLFDSVLNFNQDHGEGICKCHRSAAEIPISRASSNEQALLAWLLVLYSKLGIVTAPSVTAR